jgi:hypothetical protein
MLDMVSLNFHLEHYVGKWIVFNFFVLLEIHRYSFFIHSSHMNFLLSVVDMKPVCQVI